MAGSWVIPWKEVGETDTELKRSESYNKDYKRYMIEGFYFQRKQNMFYIKKEPKEKTQ